VPKNKDNIKLSILILSIPSRLHFLTPLMQKLEEQIGDREDVEILSIMDNKSFGISEKRNELLKLARGSHLTWIDDDDDVAENYVDRLVETIERNPEVDVISFNQVCYLEGIEARVFAQMGNPHEQVVPCPVDPTRYKDTLRPPYHWCVWKTSLAQSEDFKSDVLIPGSDVGEDIDWLTRLYPKVKNSIYLDKDVLHIYRYSRAVSESL
jgi:glycosyltransferase involved in cell wall biosynthesis